MDLTQKGWYDHKTIRRIGNTNFRKIKIMKKAFFLAAIILFIRASGVGQRTPDAGQQNPGTGQSLEFPQAEISNDILHARLYLPDAEKGYYRGTRFDWSGVMPSLEYQGHSYSGQWFPEYAPT